MNLYESTVYKPCLALYDYLNTRQKLVKPVLRGHFWDKENVSF